MPEDSVPLTPEQLKMYTHHALYPGDPALNGPFVYEFLGPVDPARLRAAAERVVRASMGLNMTFEATVGGVVGRDNRHRGYEVPLLPIEGDPAAAEEKIVAYVRGRADEPMPPGRWPLFDLRLWHGAGRVYLAFVFSHLVCDATAFWALGDLIARAYQDTDDLPARLAELAQPPSAYADPAPPADEAVTFFRELVGPLSAVDTGTLPAVRDEVGAMPGRMLYRPAAPELSVLIRNTLAAERVSPFAFHLGAYLVLLSKLTGTSRVVTGLPLANRRGARARRAIGYFVNTLPLSVDLAEFQTYDELCRSLERTTFRLLRYQDFDFTAHADEVFGGRRPPLVAVDNVFTYYKQTLALALPGVRARRLEVRRDVVKYPLLMSVENEDDGLSFIADVAPQVAPARPVECYEHLLWQVASRFDIPLRELVAVDQAEQARVDALLNARRPVPAPPSLDRRVDEVAASHGDRIAVEDAHTKITYRELHERADHAARWLVAHVEGDYVGVCGPRAVDLVVGSLAVLKAGKAYVPIDPAAPPTRLARIVDQFTELPVLLTGEVDIDPGGAHTIRLADVLAAAAPPEPPPGGAPDKVAYVVFTSGSTGAPKGVEVAHGTATRFFAATATAFGFHPDDVWSMVHSHAFDFSVWEIFGALWTGGRVVVVPQRVVRSPAELADMLEERGVTVLSQTPSAFNQLLKVLADRSNPRLAVRHLFVGGEAVRFSALAPWLELRGPACRIWDIYGPTETTIFVTYQPVTPADIHGETDSVIGRPLPDVTAYVVDEHLHPVPVGAPGELLIGGAAPARGYFRSPDLTAARFVTYPPTGERVYRTGDVCAVRPDGTLAYRSRKDRQVQLRGYRIELGEIEHALLDVPEVREAVVRVLDADSGRPRLAAYLVTADPPPTDGDLRERLRDRLPAYMVPSFFVTLPALPLTVNGKLDEAALPVPVDAVDTGSDRDDDLDPASTAARVRAIWRAAVGVAEIGLDDNFFDVGGTSMHVPEVHARLRSEFGITDLPMVELFEHTTIRLLASYLDLRRGAEDPLEPAAAEPVRVRRAGAARRRRAS